MAKSKKPVPETSRARRLQAVIERGPRPARTPHEFVQEKMRNQRRKTKPDTEPSPER
jgi:hypothetical protein